jgi:hypothetical protein
MPLLLAVLQSAATSSAATDAIDTWTKIGTGVIAGVAALFGLPIIRLTYKKTNAEIAKLELESAALRRAADAPNVASPTSDGGIQINIDGSPHAHVEVTADPRFLAPLLLLLDFILSWILVTLAGRIFAILPLDVFETPALAVFTAVLLVPLAKQALHVKAVLRPPQTTEELEATVSLVVLALLAFYSVLAVSCGSFGVLLLAISAPKTWSSGWYIGVGCSLAGIAMLMGLSAVKRAVRQYLMSIINSHSGSQDSPPSRNADITARE